MKISTKLLRAFCVLCIVMAATTSAFAAGANGAPSSVTITDLSEIAFLSAAMPGSEDAPLTMEVTNPIDLFAAGVQHIDNDSHKGSSDYERSFTCYPDNGNRLNIFLNNKGTSKAILNVRWESGSSSKDYPAIEVKAGSNHTQLYYYEDGSGLNGEWIITVTNFDGSEKNIVVSARQFQHNT